MPGHIDTCNPFVTTNILFVTITKYFFLKKENSVIGYKRADRQHFTSFKVPVNGNQTIVKLGLPITIFKILSTF